MHSCLDNTFISHMCVCVYIHTTINQIYDLKKKEKLLCIHSYLN